MTDPADQHTLLSYLYGELSASEARLVDEELEHNAEAVQQLAEHASVLALTRRVSALDESLPPLGLGALALQTVQKEARSKVESDRRSTGWLRSLFSPDRRRWAWMLPGTAVMVGVVVVAVLEPPMKSDITYEQEVTSPVPEGGNPGGRHGEEGGNSGGRHGEEGGNSGGRHGEEGGNSGGRHGDVVTGEQAEAMSERAFAALDKRGSGTPRRYRKNSKDQWSLGNKGPVTLHQEPVATGWSTKSLPASPRRSAEDGVSTRTAEGGSQVHAFLQKALSAQQEGRFVDALADLDHAEASAATDDTQLVGMVWLVRAKVYLGRSMYTKALQWAEKAETLAGFSEKSQAAMVRQQAKQGLQVPDQVRTPR